MTYIFTALFLARFRQTIHDRFTERVLRIVAYRVPTLFK